MLGAHSSLNFGPSTRQCQLFLLHFAVDFLKERASLLFEGLDNIVRQHLQEPDIYDQLLVHVLYQMLLPVKAKERFPEED